MTEPRVKVTLSANAGIAVEIGKNRIWVDALHNRKEKGFSTLTPQLLQQMQAQEPFFHPDAICYTHCHPDHYSRELTAHARKLWPDAALLLPEPEFPDQITVRGSQLEYALQELKLRFVRLPHEGEMYREVNHYGLLLQTGDTNIFLSGDCTVGCEELSAALESMPIHLAILDFPWLTLKKGREFVQHVLQPACVMLYHLPFSQDDIAGYRNSAVRCQQEYPGDVRLLMEPFQTEIYKKGSRG